MSCLEVRDRLPEHVLGVLPEEETADVERHLEWCAGCRKELAELSEGLATVPASLTLVEPPAGLEDRVVGAISVAAGRGPVGAVKRRRSGADAGRGSRPHRGVRVLAAATLAAAVLAVASIGWGVNQQRKADDIAKESKATITALERIVKSLDGRPFEAQLFPASGIQGSGTAVLVSAPGRSALLVEIVPPQPDTHPYTVRMVSKSDAVVAAGQLQPTADGRQLVLLQWFASNLALIRQVSVVDRTGRVVMSGQVNPFAAPSPGPAASA